MKGTNQSERRKVDPNKIALNRYRMGKRVYVIVKTRSDDSNTTKIQTSSANTENKGISSMKRWQVL